MVDTLGQILLAPRMGRSISSRLLFFLSRPIHERYTLALVLEAD